MHASSSATLAVLHNSERDYLQTKLLQMLRNKAQTSATGPNIKRLPTEGALLVIQVAMSCQNQSFVLLRVRVPQLRCLAIQGACTVDRQSCQQRISSDAEA